MNKLSIIGQMSELVLKPISSAQYKKLKQEGLDGELYQQLVSETDKEPSKMFGYSCIALGSEFEVYLNNEPLHIKRSFIKCFNGIHKPIVHIKNSWNLVITRTYHDGLSELIINQEFEPNQLTFELNRYKISNIGYSVVKASYSEQTIPFVSGWSDRESSFIVSPDSSHELT